MARKDCRITLFYSSLLIPSNNAKIDNILQFLAQLDTRTTYSAVQIPFPIEKVMELNLTYTYPEVNNFPYNYAAIQIGTNILYGFVSNHRLASNGSVRFTFTLDTINTYWDNFLWSPKTNITRCHKDRFVKKSIDHSAPFTLYRNVDEFDEGLQPAKFLYASNEITEINLNYDWFLIYRTEKPLSDTDLNNPLNCFVCADSVLPIASGVPTFTIQYETLDPSKYYYIVKEENTNFSATCNGISLSFNQQYGGYSPVAFKWYIYNDNLNLYALVDEGGTMGYVALSTINQYDIVVSVGTRYRYGQDTISTSGMLEMTSVSMNAGDLEVKSIESIDRTDSKIMKIIALPYAPTGVNKIGSFYDFGAYWKFENGLMKLKDINTKFSNFLVSNTFSEMSVYFLTGYSKTDLLSANYNKDYESKLYHSEFYQLKYVYDSFAKTIDLERYSNAITASPIINISFEPTNSIASSSLFKFETSNYKYLEDFEKYLFVDRNNELTLFNNDYLNYMRVGYNYDVKSRNQEIISKGISTGISVVGAIASFASSSTTGAAGVVAGISLISTAIASSASLVTSITSSERALQEKIAQLQQQSGSVSQADKFDLLKKYSNNRLHKKIYKISDRLSDAVAKIFYLTGYATNENAIPDFDSRTWFNFVQCTPFFETIDYNNNLKNEFIEDFKERFEIGVTIYHNVLGTWDVYQEKENWESWIVE